MTAMTDSTRALRAGKALTEYGDDVNESNVIDFLADVIHWCEQEGEDFERCLRIARDHHWAETHGEE
jgi:hypothetical protein